MEHKGHKQNKQQTKVTFSLQESKLRYGVIVFLAIIASLIPFAHNFVSLKEKVFNFSSLQAFLFAIGLPLSMLLYASITTYIFFYDKKYTRIRFIGFPVIFTSIFYIVWSFWDSDLPQWAYFSIIFISALAYVVTFKVVLGFRISSINKLILHFFSFIIDLRNKHDKRALKISLQKELYNNDEYEKALKEVYDEKDNAIQEEYEKYI